MWPDDRDLPLEVQAAFGADPTADPGVWEWTDLSPRLRADPIRLRAGKSGGTAHVSPGTCTATLDNDDGALTPLHPMSTYWPNVRRGTPLRVRLRRAEDAFARTTAGNSWDTADSGEAWSVGGTGASVSGGVARHSHSDVGNVRVSTLPTMLTDSEQVADFAPSALLTGAALVTGFVFRYSGGAAFYWLRCEFNSGGTSVALKISRYTTAGGYVDLATLSPVPGLTYAANTYLRVRASVVGTRLAIKAWPVAGTEPSGWHLTATDGVVTAPGKVGLQSWLVAPNSNTLPVVAQHKNYTVWVDRFNGFADQWEPDYLPTTTPGVAASAAKVTASGLLRRLEQGSKALPSAPRRFILTTSPIGYWPLEDGQLAYQGWALAGGQSMRPFAGTHPSAAVITFAQWGRGDLAPWLPETVSRSGNAGLTVIWAPVTMPAAGRWVVDFMYRSGTDAGGSVVDVNPSYLPGGALGWPQLLLGPSFRGLDVAMNGESEVTATAETLFDGQPHHVRWDAYQNGAKVSWNVYVDGNMVNAGTTAGNMTLPAVRTLALTADAQEGADMAQGHVAIWTVPPPLEDAVEAAFGYAGETAAQRIARLCAEEGIAVSVGFGESEPMGPQHPSALVELLRECEDADMGVLFEQGYGLGYRPRGDRYNAPVTATVDLAQYRVTRGGSRDVLAPVYDDQALRNEWTVGRTDGVTATVADAVHQAQVGVYADSVELNIVTDERLADHAAWRVHLGTVDELRETTFPLDIAANPELLDGWLTCGVGSRLVRTNPPAQHRPGPLDRLVEGWTETIGPRSWMTQVTPTPAAPWDVAHVDGEQRVPSDGSTLAAALSSSAMSLLLSSAPENGAWTQDPSDFPLDMRVGGEQVTASAISVGASDTFTRSSAGWGTATSGQVWATSGGSAGDYTTDTARGVMSQGTVGVLRTALLDVGGPDQTWEIDATLVPTPTGAASTYWLLGRVIDANNHYLTRLDVAPGGGTQLLLYKRGGGTLTLIAGPVSLSPNIGGTWRIGLIVHGTAGLAQLRAKAYRLGVEPDPGWILAGTDNGALSTATTATQIGVAARLESGNTTTLPVLARWDNLLVTVPQQVVLSTRGVNGVQRAWPAGTEVDVWSPAVLPL